VDKTGCINFNGAQYEVGMKLIGRKVEVLYDTTWTDEVEIHHKDFKPFKAHKLVIGENCQGSKTVVPSLTKKPSSSRLLTGLKQKAEKAKAVPVTHATRFSGLTEEVREHV
jgi:putative transposase